MHARVEAALSVLSLSAPVAALLLVPVAALAQLRPLSDPPPKPVDDPQAQWRQRELDEQESHREGRSPWGKREAPSAIEGVGGTKTRGVAVIRSVGIDSVTDPTNALPAAALKSIDKSIHAGMDSYLTMQAIDLSDLGVPGGPCGVPCIAKARELGVGEVLDLVVQRRPQGTVLLLTRVATRTGKAKSSVAVLVENDGGVPALMGALIKLYPVVGAAARMPANQELAVAFSLPPQAQHARRPAGTAAAPDPAREQHMRELVREVQKQVEDLRGIRSKRPLQVSIVDDAAFELALRSTIRGSTRALIEMQRAKWIAFGIAPNGADPEEAEEKVSTGVLGFYDVNTKQLFVRRDQAGESDEEKDAMLRRVVAHEVEHALQDQRFHMVDLVSIADDETRLSIKSLYEGEAMAVEKAWEAKKNGLPVQFSLAESANTASRAVAEALLVENGYSASIHEAPLILREQLLLQYVYGMALVANVFHSGGFPMVDQMFASPPRTSAQVLDPFAYREGTLPAQILRPLPPPLTKMVTGGTMGRLGTRVTLQVCGDAEEADEVSAQLAGDAYTVVEQKDGSLGLLWSTTWRTAEDARRFVQLVRQQRSCWQTSALDSPATGWRIGAASDVRVEGLHVGVARGFDEADLPRLVSQAATFTAVPTRSHSPHLVAAATRAALDPPTLIGLSFRDPRIGLSGPISPQLKAHLDEDGYELSVEGTHDSRMEGVISFNAKADNVEERQKIVDAVIRNTVRWLPQGVGIGLVSEQETHSLGQLAHEYLWRIGAGVISYQLDTVAVCGGKAFIAAFTVWSDAAEEREAKQFLSRLHIESANPPICADLL